MPFRPKRMPFLPIFLISPLLAFPIRLCFSNIFSTAFAVHVNSQEIYTQTIPKHITLTLTSVTLEKNSDSSYVTFYFLDDEDVKHPVCYLNEDNHRHHTLNLQFSSNSTLRCGVTGTGTLSLIGYYTDTPIIQLPTMFLPASELPNYEFSDSPPESSSDDQPSSSGE